MGARREARGLPCQMLYGEGSGVKIWINFLPAIFLRGYTERLPFCHPVIDVKNSFCSQGRTDGAWKNEVREKLESEFLTPSRNTDDAQAIRTCPLEGNFMLIRSYHFTL